MFAPFTARKYQCMSRSTSFPGLFPFELGRRPNSKGKSPGNEVVSRSAVEKLLTEKQPGELYTAHFLPRPQASLPFLQLSAVPTELWDC